MGSSNAKRILSLVVVVAYLASLGAAGASALTSNTQAATPAHQGGGDNLKVYGPAQWDFSDDSPLTGIQWHDATGTALNNPGHENSPYYDNVLLEPAYGDIADEDTQTLTKAEFQYSPSFWMPTNELQEPGSSSGLLDVGTNNALDYRQIFDEDWDPDLDTDKTENAIDLVPGVDNDNLPDVWSRNDDTGDSDDIYFPAIVNKWTFVKYDNDDNLQDWGEGDGMAFPMSSDGDQPGLDGFMPINSQDDTQIDDIDNGNYFRLKTDSLDIAEDETIQFGDFQATLINTQAADSDVDDTAKFRIDWLGKEGDPKKVKDVTIKEGKIITASRTTADSPGDCTAGNKPTHTANRVWFLCTDTVDADSDLVSVEVGRVITDRDTDASKATMLIDGVLYTTSNIDYATGANLNDFTIEQVNPLGDGVGLASIGVTLVGTASGNAVPVLPPFDRSHDVIADLELETDRNNYEFYQDDGTDDPIDQIRLHDDDEFIEDRVESRSALSLMWHAKAQEKGLLAHQQSPAATTTSWSTTWNNVYPSHYVEVSIGEQAIVESGLFNLVNGQHRFLWNPDNPEALHFGSSVRLFSESIDDGSTTSNDRLIFEPTVIEGTDSLAGDTNADPLVELFLSHDAIHRFSNEDSDSATDLDLLDDEDQDTDFDGASDSDDDDIDVDGDNLWDAEESNSGTNDGDQYAPALIQEQRYNWLNRGTDNPMEATLTSADMSQSDSNTEIRLPITSDETGEGLTGWDSDGDGTDDETIVEHWDSTNSVLRVETELLSVSSGDEAQFLDHKVKVRSTSNDKTANLRIWQMDSGSGEQVISSQSVDEGNFFGVSYDYSNMESSDASAGGPATSIRGTTGSPTWDAFFFVDQVTGDNVEISLGRFLPSDAASGSNTILVDQNLYRLGSVTDTDNDATGDGIESFTLVHTTPIGASSLEVGQDDTELNSVATGSSAPVMPPYNADHTILQTNGQDLETSTEGFFDTSIRSDNDDTDADFDDRLIEVGPLDVTIDALNRMDQSWVWHDAETDTQMINGIFEGSSSTPPSAGTAGWPSSTFNPPNHEGKALSTSAFANEVVNSQRGYDHFVGLSIPDGHGQTILESNRITHDDDNAIRDTSGDTVKNIVKWRSTNTPGVTPTSSVGWLLFEDTDFSGLLLGDGTVPSDQQTPPQDQKKTEPQASFSYADLSCDPATFKQGEVTTCTVTATNDGDASGSDTAVLNDGDKAVATGTTGSVAAGDSTQMSIIWDTPSTIATGSHSLSVGSATTSITVEEGEDTGPGGQPDLQITAVSVSPSDASLDDTVTVTANVQNNGKAAGAPSFTVTVDGNAVGSIAGSSIAAGGTGTATGQITVSQNLVGDLEPGKSKTLTIAAGGQSAQVTVTAEEPDKPKLPGFETVALIAAAGAALVLLGRRD